MNSVPFSDVFDVTTLQRGIVNETRKEMKALASWQRAEFIEKGGWDKMPGEEKAGGYTASRACADGLEVLIEK